MTTPAHCPGFQQFKSLKSFICNCSKCNAPKEIFSDEFEKPHKCDKCGEEIDFTTCTPDVE